MKKIIAFLLLTTPLALTSVDKFIAVEKEKAIYDEFSAKNIIAPLTVNPIPTPTPNPATLFFSEINDAIETVEITYTDIEYEYIGTYFITAYCPAECGWNGDADNLTGWYTASGEICHRADYEDRLFEPTTCAIDRSLHSFGELFYVEELDRVFVAEDTGSAVKGKHLDLFYEDYDDVVYFPTGYYTVYSVEYVTKTVEK